MKLKHFALVSEHPTHFKLQDLRDKKEFSIAKKGISPEHSEIIKTKLPKVQMLSEGGKAKDKETDSILDKKARMDKDNREAQELGADPVEYTKDIKDLMAKSKDITPQHFDEGGLALASDPSALMNAAPPTSVAAPSQGDNFNNGQPSPSEIPFTMAGMTDQQPLPPAASPMPESRQPASAPSMPSSVPPPANSLPQTPEQQMPGLNPMVEYNQGLSNIKQGINEQVSAEQNKADDLAQAYEKQAKDMDAAKADYSKHLDTLNSQGQKLFDYINDPKNKVNPNKYWDDKSTGSRIGAAIAIAIGGLGSGITGQNPALDVINRAIDRDMRAQENDLNNKQNLLSQNLAMTKDLQQAKAMTFSQLSTIAAAKANMATANALGPEAAARGKELTGQLLQQSSQAHMGMAANQAMMNMTNSQGGPGDTDNIGRMISNLAVVDPAKAKAMQERFVPGVGLSSIPVPEKAREELISRQNLDQQLTNLRTFAQKHEGSLDPAIVNEGKAMAGAVQDAYRRANGQGVFREAEKKFVEGMISEDPTSFFNKYRVDPRYKAVANSNLMELNGLKRGYGLRSSVSGPAGNIPFIPYKR